MLPFFWLWPSHSWYNTYNIKVNSKLKSPYKELIDTFDVCFKEQILTINDTYQEKDSFTDRIEEISSSISEQLDELILDTNKDQLVTLKKSLSKRDSTDLINKWWDEELPVKVTEFLDTHEEFLRRWFDNLNPTHSLRRRFQTYDQLKDELSSNIGDDQWVTLVKECFNSLIMSSDTGINSMMQKSIDREDGILNVILKILDSVSYTQREEILHGKRSTFEEGLSSFKEMKFDLTVTEHQAVPRKSVLDDGNRVITRTEVKSVKVDLDSLNSALDLKNLLVQRVTEEFNSSRDAFIDKIYDHYEGLGGRSMVKPRWRTNEEAHELSIELDVLWIDRDLIDDIKNLIEQEKRILGEWKWLENLTVEYSNLPTRQEWADDYVENQWMLMQELCYDMLDKGFTVMDQVISLFNDCHQFVIEMIQVTTDTVHNYQVIIKQFFWNNWLWITPLGGFILYFMIWRLMFKLILKNAMFIQQPIAFLMKTTGYLGLMIGSSVMLGGKWRGLNNFMVELIAKFLNLDGLGLWLTEQVTGIELEEALSMAYMVGGASIMFISFIFLLLARDEQSWGNALRLLNHGFKPLEGLNPRWLNNWFNKKVLVEEQLNEGRSKEEILVKEHLNEDGLFSQDFQTMIERIREFNKWLRVHKQKQRVQRTFKEEIEQVFIDDIIILNSIIKKKRDEGVDDENLLDESLRDFIEVKSKKIKRDSNIGQGNAVSLDDLTKFCEVVKVHLVRKTIEDGLATTEEEALEYWDSEGEKVLSNLLSNSSLS